jgi:hypothetical protein
MINLDKKGNHRKHQIDKARKLQEENSFPLYFASWKAYSNKIRIHKEDATKKYKTKTVAQVMINIGD